MFRFDKEQLVIDIAGVKMGGQPGEYPTVLAGTIFYGGHNIISDEKEGIFDKDAAEERIKTMEEMSDVTGNPCVVQTFGALNCSCCKNCRCRILSRSRIM